MRLSLTLLSPLSQDIGDDVIGRKVTQKTACVPEMTNHVYTKDGNVVEIFTDVSVGCTANINTITRLASLALRSGVKVEEVLKQMRKENCSACMDRRKQGDKAVAKSCGNSIANAIEKVYKEMNGAESLKKKDNGMLKCPECGEKTLISTGKCFTCTNCTYNKCD
jgi:ribonucleoside-diphosphate reductase alpha chain